jgi:hypothetical protein
MTLVKLIQTIITLCVLGGLLMFGGCCALSVAGPAIVALSDSVSDRRTDQALQQAKNAPLPLLVQRLIDDDDLGWMDQGMSRQLPGIPVGLGFGSAWLPQDPRGRYILTSQGLYNFATASQTPLTCTKTSSRPYMRRLWLDDQNFIWGQCTFQLTTLQPGVVEAVRCGPERAGCGGDELATALVQVLRQSNRVYFGSGEYLFVRLSVDAPPHVWVDSAFSAVTSKELIAQAGLVPAAVPSQDGRSIATGTHRRSPDGAYDASFDGARLTIVRTQDGALVTQARQQDFHQTFGVTSQHMSVAGWTDDSHQVIFLVRTILNSRRSLVQVFALRVP